MKIRLLLMLILALLEAKALWASIEPSDTGEDPPATTALPSLMTLQDMENNLSNGLAPLKKQRIHFALAPAKQEYLTQDFITIVQGFSHDMPIYEKCYVIRAVMKLPAEYLTTLSNLLSTDRLEHIQSVPNSERIDYIKRLSTKNPDQWEKELISLFVKHLKCS